MTQTALADAFTKAAGTIKIAFSGVVMPANPPIDKIAALSMLALHNQIPLETVDHYIWNECSAEQFKIWDDLNMYPIDIGDRKYHKAGMPSATQWLATRYQLKLSPGEKKVLELINKNNRSGFLKGFHFAVPYILRELYQLNEDVDWMVSVINAAADVVTMFIYAENGKVMRSADAPMDEALARLAQKLRQDDDQPFTLGRYLRDLWLLGYSSEEIQKKIAFWREGMQKLECERARANAAFRALQRPDTFNVDGMQGIVLYTSDHFLAKAVVRSKLYAVRLVVADDGHVAISTDKLKVRSLFHALDRLEPGCWYGNHDMGALINGGPQYKGVEPTSLNARDLIKLIQEHLRASEKK